MNYEDWKNYEYWKRCAGYEQEYIVSNKGRIASLPKPNGSKKIKIRDISKSFDGCGYIRVTMHKNGVYKKIRLHTLIAETFIGSIPSDHTVDHLNRIKTDNSLKNLRILSHAQNVNAYYSNNRKNKYGVININGKYVARIKINKKTVHIGTFKEKNDAYDAFYKKFIEVRGFAPWESR